MREKWITCGMVAGILVLMQAAPTLGEDAAFQPGIGIGVMASPTYHQYMMNVYDGSGGYAWLNVGISGKIPISDQWALLPAFDAYLSSVTYGIGGTKTQINNLLVPSVNVRYSFRKISTFYLQAGPTYSIPSGGGSHTQFKEGGVGGAASLGYAFKHGIELDLGYDYTPVDATRTSDGTTTTENFGGPFLRVGYRF